MSEMRICQGATDILGLRESAEWIRVAPGTALESSVRV